MASGLRRSSGGAWLEEDEADDAEPTSPLSAATPETPCTEASPQTLDDRRYRASIHALEAEVDTLLSRAAGRGWWPFLLTSSLPMMRMRGSCG